MNKFGELTKDDFIINGEVNERLPQHNKNILKTYPLDGTSNPLEPKYTIDSTNVNSTILAILSKSNIAVSNGAIEFTGDNDSYVQLSSKVFDADKLEVEVNFKVNSFISDSILFESEELIIKIDSENKFMYALMPYNTDIVKDLPNGGIRLTSNNSIVLNKEHNFKMIKYQSITRFNFDHNRARSLFAKNGIPVSSFYLGRGFRGIVKDVKFFHLNSTEPEYFSVNLPNKYSIVVNINVKSYNHTLLMRMSEFLIKSEMGLLTISCLNYSKSIQIDENKDYLFILNSNQSSYDFILIDKLNNIEINKDSFTFTNSGKIDVFNNGSLSDFVIYKSVLTEKEILNIRTSKLRLTNNGDILNTIDETSGHTLMKSSATSYHLQLTRDLNSDCKTITMPSDNLNFVDGGVESKSSYKPVRLSFFDQVGLRNTFDIIYKKKITSLGLSAQYDSFQNWIAWGVERNKFVLKYERINAIGKTVYVEGITPSEVMNEWIVVSISYSSDVFTLTLVTHKGTFTAKMEKTFSFIVNYYDMYLGSKMGEMYGSAIYRDMTIVNGWIVDTKYKEALLNTKLSYRQNKIISNVKIIEQLT